MEGAEEEFLNIVGFAEDIKKFHLFKKTAAGGICGIPLDVRSESNADETEIEIVDTEGKKMFLFSSENKLPNNLFLDPTSKLFHDAGIQTKNIFGDGRNGTIVERAIIIDNFFTKILKLNLDSRKCSEDIKNNILEKISKIDHISPRFVEHLFYLIDTSSGMNEVDGWESAEKTLILRYLNLYTASKRKDTKGALDTFAMLFASIGAANNGYKFGIRKDANKTFIGNVKYGEKIWSELTLIQLFLLHIVRIHIKNSSLTIKEIYTKSQESLSCINNIDNNKWTNSFVRKELFKISEKKINNINKHLLTIKRVRNVYVITDCYHLEARYSKEITQNPLQICVSKLISTRGDKYKILLEFICKEIISNLETGYLNDANFCGKMKIDVSLLQESLLSKSSCKSILYREDNKKKIESDLNEIFPWMNIDIQGLSIDISIKHKNIKCIGNQQSQALS